MNDQDDDDDEIDLDDRPILPPEAGENTSHGFEPDDDWLRAANPKLQHEAMRQWFMTRYEDPAMQTPFADGEYVYIHGGPYEADDVLYDRFADVVENPDKGIRRVIDDVESDGIYEWAPIHDDREYEYDDRFSLSILAKSEPLQRLRDRLAQSKEVLSLEGSAAAKVLAQKMVFASAIGTVEAFLYEVAYFWIDTDEQALRNVVTNLPEFRDEKIKLGELFARLDGLKDHVKGRLQTIVWHRWDQVAQIYRAALNIRLPSLKELDAALLKRHDIIHRSGHDKNGNPVTISIDEIQALYAVVETFASEVDRLIGERGIEKAGAGIDAKGPDELTSPTQEF